MVEISEGALKEKHEKGKIILQTYSKVRKHTNFSYAEWRTLTFKYVLPQKRHIYTNPNGTGVIDIAEKESHNLNINEKFKVDFWRDCDIGLGTQMENEDPDVRRGYICADGQVRIDVDESERFR